MSAVICASYIWANHSPTIFFQILFRFIAVCSESMFGEVHGDYGCTRQLEVMNLFNLYWCKWFISDFRFPMPLKVLFTHTDFKGLWGDSCCSLFWPLSGLCLLKWLPLNTSFFILRLCILVVSLVAFLSLCIFSVICQSESLSIQICQSHISAILRQIGQLYVQKYRHWTLNTCRITGPDFSSSFTDKLQYWQNKERL